jgi:hypothetical protein
VRSDSYSCAAALEAHGTGTALGDPIEVGAAALALEDEVASASLKANVGHLEAVAGGAGTVSLLLIPLLAARVSPNAQLRRLNPHLDSLIREGGFSMPVKDALLRATHNIDGRVSSFGATGTIAHGLFVGRWQSWSFAPRRQPASMFRCENAGPSKAVASWIAIPCEEIINETLATSIREQRQSLVPFSILAILVRACRGDVCRPLSAVDRRLVEIQPRLMMLDVALSGHLQRIPSARASKKRREQATPRVLFLHGMDTYGEFQARLLDCQGWLKAAEWVTTSAPHRGADFSGGAGGVSLRARFGYEPGRSRSWRLISEYSVTSKSQAEMFARIRRATDASADEYGLLGDWAASVDLVVRAATEQAPLDGIAGISEGGTVGAILFSQHLRGEVYLGSGYRGRLVLTFCALTSPAHSRMYADPMPCLASLHLTGDTDTADVWHMGGQTAALFGPWSGVGHFHGASATRSGDATRPGPSSTAAPPRPASSSCARATGACPRS